jgi:hypothetical protein
VRGDATFVRGELPNVAGRLSARFAYTGATVDRDRAEAPPDADAPANAGASRWTMNGVLVGMPAGLTA